MNLKTPHANFAHEPTLNCPNCRHEIRLTESLAAPLIEKTRRSFQEQLAHKDAEVARNLDLVRKEREDLAKAREQVDDQVAHKIAAERAQVITAEAKKAREAVLTELQAKETETAELRRNLEANNAKLAEAQQAHAGVLRKQRELEEEKRELDLTVEKRVLASVEEVRTKAKQDADEAARLRVMEKDQTIESMARTIEELKRKAEQGSQQSQGEVLELELEEILRSRFPTDVIDPVGKGELGADLVQQVNAGIGQSAGTILWESKRTKAWHDGWLPKLRDDQRRCAADVALIVSQVLPKNVDSFDLIDGVWIAHPRTAIPLAIALCQTLIEVHGTRLVQQGHPSEPVPAEHLRAGLEFQLLGAAQHLSHANGDATKLMTDLLGINRNLMISQQELQTLQSRDIVRRFRHRDLAQTTDHYRHAETAPRRTSSRKPIAHSFSLLLGRPRTHAILE
ncbi:DUF2130 domain-containing protein [Bradyrhizobium sp. SK17]|jgi:hypothetical protein|nr:DUF2130 domain-containing protein [Bradyrhizobium sp. SK17]AUC94740.1 DUF2130 domain-containing protein [Bradyrhizobium sp. SK17]